MSNNHHMCVAIVVIENSIFVLSQTIDQQQLSHVHDSGNHYLCMAPSFEFQSFPANLTTLFNSKSFSSIQNIKHRNSCSSLLYCLSMVLIMQSGDLHPNPGPYKPKYPCNICNKAAKWGQRATCCDNCNQWYHVDCMSMSTPSYEFLQDTKLNVSWYCNNCGNPNYANSYLFSSTSLDLSNSFSCLSDLSNASNTFGFPLATSSPHDTANHVSGHKSPKSPKPKPKHRSCSGRNKNSLKFMIINFDGISDKTSDLAVSIENYHPDVIIGTETHLKGNINSSELFPPEFSVIRKFTTGKPTRRAVS